MHKENFDRQWRFHLGDPAGMPWDKLDDSTWRCLDLPHDWSIELPRRPENPSGTSGGYFEMGKGWYRKHFTAPQTWRGKKVWIEFEGVYMNAEVWLNAEYLGRHPYGYTSFSYDLTPFLKLGEENLLRVRVDNTHQLNSRWYSGSGIYRHVWLWTAEAVHIGLWGVAVTTPQVSPLSAMVHVQTQIINESALPQQINLRSTATGEEGILPAVVENSYPLDAGARLEIGQDLSISNPRLWSPGSPQLYQLESTVLVGDRVLDQQLTPFGIRSLQFSAAEGFRLNGLPLKLKGGCVHHDNGILGATSYDRAEERKVELHKANGFNAIRCAHNPPAPSFLDACDRLGMLVIDEAFDCWHEGKNIGDYHVSFDAWWQQDIDSMLLRDRNHPSIILWSIGNEVLERDGHSGGVQIARMLAERVRQKDATRPVISAINGFWGAPTTWPVTDPVFSTLDVGGYNYELRQYRTDHQRLPERMIIGTESTAMEACDHWLSVEELPYVLGDFVWTSLDYLGESGIGRVHDEGEKTGFLGSYPWHQANCGDLDLCGFKRPQSFYRDILWKVGSPLYIAVHTPLPEGKTPKITYWGWPDVQPSWNWTGQEGRVLKVDVYSACEQVELWLNGRSLGIQPTGRAEKFTASFEVPYQTGELKAVGYHNEGAVAETSLSSTGPAAALRLSPDRAHLRAEHGDLSYVTVEVVDAEGRIHPCADRPVYFTVKGPGTIEALGSADPVSTEPYRGNVRSTFHGRALVVVKASAGVGAIKLRAQADGLESAEVVLVVGTAP